jgi:hypothetical protein
VGTRWLSGRFIEMARLDIFLEGDGAFKDLQTKYGDPIELSEEEGIRITGLHHGMTSGRPSVAFAFILPEDSEGRWVFAQTTLRLLLVAARALEAKFSDPFSEKIKE